MNNDTPRDLQRIVAQSPAAGPRPGPARVIALGLTAVAASLLGVVAAFGTVPDSGIPQTTLAIQQQLNPTIERIADDSAAFVSEERFQRGDTVATLLDRLGVDDADTRRLLAQPQAAAQFRWLRTGTPVQSRTSPEGNLLDLWFITPQDKLVTIQPKDGGFMAEQQPASLNTEVLMKSGEIRSSLFAATDNANVPDSVAVQMADVFAGDVDFHRDLRKGDRFTVVYEMLSHQGRMVRSGRLLAAEFINQKRVLRAVWFQDESSKGGYYTPEGKNLRKAFLRSPLEFSRVTSGFSMRFHPLLQKWRAHKGVDYGAPSGTRVKVTGDGVVEQATRQDGYGNVITVRHNSGLTTWYAHLSGFAAGLRKGTRVSQGEVIGYVGQTGWATGPHLHYEFRVNNEHRNPLTIALPAAEPLPANRVATFRAATATLVSRLELLRDTNLALLE